MDFQVEAFFEDKKEDKKEDKRWRVTLAGEVDIFSSTELREKLIQLVKENPADMHVDCQNLEYIDSTGLGALVGVVKHIKSHNRAMHLFNVKPNILKLFHITNLDKVFMIEGGASNEEA